MASETLKCNSSLINLDLSGNVMKKKKKKKKKKNYKK